MTTGIAVTCVPGTRLAPEWSVRCDIDAYRVTFALDGPGVRRGRRRDPLIVVTLTQCQSSPLHGAPVDAPPAVVATPPCAHTGGGDGDATAVGVVVEAVVYVRAPGRTLEAIRADPSARVHVLVQSAPSYGDDGSDDGDGGGDDGVRTVGTVPLGAVLAPLKPSSSQPLSFTVGSGRRAIRFTVCAHSPLALPVQFATDADMRALLHPLRGVRIDGPTTTAPAVAPLAASSCACAGYAHTAATTTTAAAAAVPATAHSPLPHADPHRAPVRHSDPTWERDDYADWHASERPEAARFPRDLTAAPRVAAALARLMTRLTTPRPLARDEQDALRHWLRAAAESWITGITGTAGEDELEQQQPQPQPQWVPWAAIANGPGGERVRAHTRAAHVRHVRALWEHTPAARAYALVDATDPHTGHRPVLVAVPRANGAQYGGTCAFVYAPGVWRWPVPFDPAPYRYRDNSSGSGSSSGGGIDLGVWTPEHLRALHTATPAHAEALERAAQVAVRTQHPQFPSVRDHSDSFEATHSVCDWTIRMFSQCVYSDIIKRST